MSLDDIYRRLTEILREVFNDDSIVARPDLSADQVVGWDSFAYLRVIFSVEQAFEINVAASDITSLKNVGELAQLIDAKVNA